MNYCTSCGHELGVGRFCTNCGTPVPGRHPAAAPASAPSPAPSATPPATPPAVPPTVGTAPPAARYPLYADTRIGEAPSDPPPLEGVAAPLPAYSSTGRGRRGGRLLVALAALLALLVIGAGVAAYSLFSGSGDAHSDRPDTRAAQPVSPTTRGHRHHRHAGGADGTGVTDEVTAIDVPGTAPASTDLAGHRVTFGARNLVDGDLQTAWRIAGDATGGSITITFAHPVTLTSVGLVNGYAKKYPGYNGYWLNRKVTEVRWTFDDGSTFTQRLRRVTRMQTLPVDPGPTSSITVDILATVPSNKPNGRDYTAISELSLEGSAG
jgi:hypothetical protein